MTCPKCNAVQPESDTCTKCQVIIAKYLEYLDTQQQPFEVAELPDDTTRTRVVESSRPVPKGLIFLIILIAALGILWQQGYMNFLYPKTGSFNEETGLYVNKRFGFSIKVPDYWSESTVEEAITCGSIKQDYSQFYYFITGPGEPDEERLVINTWRLNSGMAEHFKSKPPEYWALNTANGRPLLVNKTEDIGGLEVHRYGYMFASYSNTYRENALFISGNDVIQIYYVVWPRSYKTDLHQEMNDIIDSLKKI